MNITLGELTDAVNWLLTSRTIEELDIKMDIINDIHYSHTDVAEITEPPLEYFIKVWKKHRPQVDWRDAAEQGLIRMMRNQTDPFELGSGKEIRKYIETVEEYEFRDAPEFIQWADDIYQHVTIFERCSKCERRPPLYEDGLCGKCRNRCIGCGGPDPLVQGSFCLRCVERGDEMCPHANCSQGNMHRGPCG